MYTHELKAIDVSVNAVQDTTGSVVLANGCARGSSFDTRIGSQICLKSLEFRGSTSVTAVTGVSQFHRVILLYDLQTNGLAPALTDVLVSSSYVALPNLANRSRFLFLVDKTFQLNFSADSGSARSFSFRVPLYDRPVSFNSGNTGTVGDISTGALFLFTIGSIAPGATAGSTIGTLRVRYTDN